MFHLGNRSKVFLIILLIIASNCMATSSKRQVFRIVGISGGNEPLFVFHESAVGGREDYRLFFVFLLKKGPVTLLVQETHVDSVAHNIFESLPSDSLSLLEFAGGAFRIDRVSSISSPIGDTTFKFGYQYDEPRLHTAAYWNSNCTTDCVDDPIFQGADYERIYLYKQGLYKNYNIAKAYKNSDATFIVVLTENTMRAHSNDMMSGVLVFRKTPAQ